MGVNDSFIKLYQHYDPDPHEMNEVNCNLKQVRVVPLTWPELEPLPPVPFSFPGMEATAELPFINHSISNIKDILVCIFRLFIQEPYLCCLSDKNLHGYCSISRASRIFSGGGGQVCWPINSSPSYPCLLPRNSCFSENDCPVYSEIVQYLTLWLLPPIAMLTTLPPHP